MLLRHYDACAQKSICDSLLIYKSLNKIGDTKICIGFHLSYLDDLIRSEREGLLFH